MVVDGHCTLTGAFILYVIYQFIMETFLDMVDYKYYFQPIEYYDDLLDDDGRPFCKWYDHVGQRPSDWKYIVGIELHDSTYVCVRFDENDQREMHPMPIGPMPPSHHGPQCPWDIHHPTYRPIPR